MIRNFRVIGIDCVDCELWSTVVPAHEDGPDAAVVIAMEELRNIPEYAACIFEIYPQFVVRDDGKTWNVLAINYTDTRREERREFTRDQVELKEMPYNIPGR